MNRPRARREISSGGVIFRRRGDRIEVAVIKHKDLKGDTAWSLPKGLVETGESPEETAVREVREETGLQGKIVEKLGEIDYWFYSKRDKKRIHKTVHFFLLQYVAGSTEDHDWEVEEVVWMTPDEALNRLTYENERQILEKAVEILTGYRS